MLTVLGTKRGTTFNLAFEWIVISRVRIVNMYKKQIIITDDMDFKQESREMWMGFEE